MRYVWDQYEDFGADSARLPRLPWRCPGAICSVDGIDHWVANSDNVAAKIASSTAATPPRFIHRLIWRVFPMANRTVLSRGQRLAGTADRSCDRCINESGLPLKIVGAGSLRANLNGAPGRNRVSRLGRRQHSCSTLRGLSRLGLSRRGRFWHCGGGSSGKRPAGNRFRQAACWCRYCPILRRGVVRPGFSSQNQQQKPWRSGSMFERHSGVSSPLEFAAMRQVFSSAPRIESRSSSPKRSASKMVE